MASPEVMEPESLDSSACQDVLSAPEGWRKTVMTRKVGTPKKKDIVYVAPDGEEIKTRRQLEKYLKNHPGGPSLADFDWGTGETPRRSARLSSKGRLPNEGEESEPVLKRSKAESDEEGCVVVSPKRPSKRKSGTVLVDAGKDVVMEEADKGVFPEEGNRTSEGSEKVGDKADGKLQNEIEESTDDVLLTEQTIVENSADKVNTDEQASVVEQSVVNTESIIEQIVVVEAATESAVEDVAKISEGEPSFSQGHDVIQAENENILDVPTVEKLDGLDSDALKSKDCSDSHCIRALIDEPVAKSPEQLTEPAFPDVDSVEIQQETH